MVWIGIAAIALARGAAGLAAPWLGRSPHKAALLNPSALTPADVLAPPPRPPVSKPADGARRLDPLVILRQVMDGLRNDAAGRAVTLLAPQPVGGFVIDARPGALAQLLHILLSHAIRHNRPGGAVLAEVRQTREGLSIRIHDTGPGFQPEALVRIFHPSFEASARGLSTAQLLARALGGRLSATSRPGHGSTFTLSLPGGSTLDRRASVLPQRDPTLIGATLLHVEADPAAVALVRHIVGALGAALHVCANGEEGLALARDLRADLILVEPSLSGMDGFHLKAKLDADGLTRGIPVVALSSDPDPALARRGRQAGFSGWLTQPLDIALFNQTLVRQLAHRSEMASALSRPDELGVRPRSR